jgi:uncharacterized RDD family membrane protein YckC
VVLDLPYARFPTRLLAWLIDALVEVVVLFAVLVLIGAGVETKVLDSASGAAALLAGNVLVIVGYPVACETLSRGRTAGMMALGLRVVANDGGPERFRHALVRALAGTVECWLLIGVPALVTAMLSARGKRLGDVFAGTFVVRERAPKTAVSYTYPVQAGGNSAAYIDPSLRPWAASLELSALPDQFAAAAASYLSRFWQLSQAAREQLGKQLAAGLAARVSPPAPAGMAPADYLYTVLAERRNRQLARLSPPAWAARGPAAPPAPAAAAYPAPPWDANFIPPA